MAFDVSVSVALSLFCMSSGSPDRQVLWDQNTLGTTFVDRDPLSDLSHGHGGGQGWLLRPLPPGPPRTARE